MNDVFIRNPRRPAWPAQSGQVKALLGLNEKAKLPVEGMEGRFVQGIFVHVISLAQAREFGVFHRVIAVCPQCDRSMSAGRLRQHKCAVNNSGGVFADARLNIEKLILEATLAGVQDAIDQHNKGNQ